MSLKALGGFIGDNEFLGMHNPLWRTIRRRKSGFKWEETAQRRRRKRVAGGLYLKDLVQVGIGYHQLIFFFLVWLNLLIAWNSWVNGPFPILITFYDPIIHLGGLLERWWTGNLFREINLKGAVRNYSAIHTTVKYHHQRSFELDSNDQLFSGVLVLVREWGKGRLINQHWIKERWFCKFTFVFQDVGEVGPIKEWQLRRPSLTFWGLMIQSKVASGFLMEKGPMAASKASFSFECQRHPYFIKVPF